MEQKYEKVNDKSVPKMLVLAALVSRFNNRYQATADRFLGDISWKQISFLRIVKAFREIPAVKVPKRNDRMCSVKINAAANIITAFRFVFAVAMLFFRPFSFAFWVLYSLCGMSDIIDGIVARKTHSESRFGEMLDSTADLFFAMVCAVTVFTNVLLPTWFIQAIAIIALIKVVGYAVGFCKHHRFHSPHTVLNKTVGLMLFLSPLIYVWLGLTVTGAVLCPVSVIAATQELLLSIRGDKKLEQ